MSVSGCFEGWGCSALPMSVTGDGVGEANGHFPSLSIRGRLLGGSLLSRAGTVFCGDDVLFCGAVSNVCAERSLGCDAVPLGLNQSVKLRLPIEGFLDIAQRASEPGLSQIVGIYELPS